MAACASEPRGIFRPSELPTWCCTFSLLCVHQSRSFGRMVPRRNLLCCVPPVCLSSSSRQNSWCSLLSPREPLPFCRDLCRARRPTLLRRRHQQLNLFRQFRTCSFSERFSSSMTVVELAPFGSGVCVVCRVTSMLAFPRRAIPPRAVCCVLSYVLESYCFADSVPGIRSASSATKRIS